MEKNNISHYGLIKLDTQDCELEILFSLKNTLQLNSSIYLEYYCAQDKKDIAALQSINNEFKKSDRIIIRHIKYLNNIAEQDHRFIKKITRPTLGFKSYPSGHATLIGIELHHRLHKGQHTNSNNMPVFEQFYALVA